MPQTTISMRTRKPSGEVRRLLRSLPSALSGEISTYEAERLRGAFISHTIYSLFESVHKGFMDKSSGGADELGNVWPPLAPSTIAAKLRKRQRRRPRGQDQLSKVQEKKWLRTYNAARRAGRGGGLAGDALTEFANQHAWLRLQKENKLSPVPINIDTTRLEKSLRPGETSRTTYRPPEEQVVQVSGARIRIGTEVPYSSFVHKGSAKQNRPPRRLWPTGKEMRPWSKRATHNGAVKMGHELKRLLS